MTLLLLFWQKSKGWLLPLVVGVALFVGGYATGRFALPAKTVVTEKVVTVEKQVVVTNTKTEVQIVKVKDESMLKKLHREIVESTKPDGTKETKTTEDLNVDSVVHEHEQDTKVQYVDRIIEKWHENIVEKTKTVENKKPDWMIAADVGYSIPSALGKPELGVPGMKGAVVGLRIERRVIGPLFMGAFGNTQGTAGLSVGGLF